MASSLPQVPVKHRDFVDYIQSHPDIATEDLVRPYNDYDATARKIFAQDLDHPLLRDNQANIVPLYNATGSTDIRVRARDLASETPEQKEKYLLPLNETMRRSTGSPAVVPMLGEFQKNFAIFTEGALSELNWNNVVTAGSAVVTPLLPVPEKYRKSKRALRQYYHDEFAPASDVDLFLYGLTEDQAIEKIKHIEETIKNSILHETTTIRAKNAITIASQYPTRHVQVVLRIYRSVAEILTGFDVDCSCAAYDGQKVYASPRAIASYVTQVNQIDLTRRSPSYENRLSKYSHRGFEVFWPQLDRPRIDPTIYERSFKRTEGLARLLVLEKLPQPSDRDAYLDKRRQERGRPPQNYYLRRRQNGALKGNLKDDWEDEVPEWQEEDQVSSYHTFTVPYGRRFNARKIEKLLYTKDLLLNAQWNHKDRKVDLHRHPAFFGDVEYVIGDCCGFCPLPVTDEERKVAEEESKIYISGNVKFIKDDPGRQEIGSFNPITETDWTEMAYVGHTELLCQAIVSGDTELVKRFLEQENADPNRRDYTGRTPLQLACMSSTPAVVQCLVDHSAFLTPRMADGKTALHIAASRGDVDVVRILLTRSRQNEEEATAKKATDQGHSLDQHTRYDKVKDEDDSDMADSDEDSPDDESSTSASFVKIDNDGMSEQSVDATEHPESQLDIYDVNAAAWDSHASPIHLAILHGHVEIVKALVASFGADLSIPVKHLHEYSRQPDASKLNLVLALALHLEKAIEMSQALLQLGASPTQTDINHLTPVHYIAQSDYVELLDVYLEHDEPAVHRAINHLALLNAQMWSHEHIFSSVLISAFRSFNPVAARRLLKAGAKPAHEQSDFAKAFKSQMPDALRYSRADDILTRAAKQPIFFAVDYDQPLIALDLLDRGVDPNVQIIPARGSGETVLDRVRSMMNSLQRFVTLDPNRGLCRYLGPKPLPDDTPYLAEFEDGTYAMFAAKTILNDARKEVRETEEKYQPAIPESETRGADEQKKAVAQLICDYQTLENRLLELKAKTFAELNPGDPHNTIPFQAQLITQHVPDEVFKIEFNFRTPEITDALRDGYRQLFEAAWKGDLDTIESLTRGMWGSSHDQPPLELAVSDGKGFTCLNIAILRGHMDVAKKILCILQSQYKPEMPDAPKRYEIDVDNASLDGEDINIVGHTVNDQLTHDAIGEVTTRVESHVSPLMALQAIFPAFLFLDETPSSDIKLFPASSSYADRPIQVNNLMKYAICKNDLGLLEFLFNSSKDLAPEFPVDEAMLSAAQEAFQVAIKLGRTECLVQLIKATGVGFPLAKLGEASRVKSQEDPRYYQGLSVRGKKRKDWAEAGINQKRAHSARPPLLVAAVQGSLISTEWFLGTTPGRLYLEYVTSHQEDENIQRLAQSKLGLEGSVLTWLQTRRYLVLHCAVMSKPCEESERLVQYLVDHHPECLEVRSSGGQTALALAFSLRRISFARILIAAGANQTVRDSEGNNLLHHLLYSTEAGICRDPDIIPQLTEMLDPSLVPGMLLERAGTGSWTPFARWLQSYPHFYQNSQCVEVKSEINIVTSTTTMLLDLAIPSNQKHLELLDGSGNTPVHCAVKRGFIHVLKLMLNRRPDLLYRENATGSTPLEMAVDSWVNNVTLATPANPFNNRQNNQMWLSTIQRDPRSFIEERDNRTNEETMLRTCEQFAQQSPGRRGLVSLYDANEVAKRLAVQRPKPGDGGMHVYRCRCSHCRRSCSHCRRSYQENSKEIDEVALWGPMARM